MEQSTHSYIHSVHSSRSLNGKSTTSRVLKFKKRKYIDPIYDMTFWATNQFYLYNYIKLFSS